MPCAGPAAGARDEPGLNRGFGHRAIPGHPVSVLVLNVLRSLPIYIGTTFRVGVVCSWLGMSIRGASEPTLSPSIPNLPVCRSPRSLELAVRRGYGSFRLRGRPVARIIDERHVTHFR